MELTYKTEVEIWAVFLEPVTMSADNDLCQTHTTVCTHKSVEPNYIRRLCQNALDPNLLEMDLILDAYLINESMA